MEVAVPHRRARHDAPVKGLNPRLPQRVIELHEGEEDGADCDEAAGDAQRRRDGKEARLERDAGACPPPLAEDLLAARSARVVDARGDVVFQSVGGFDDPIEDNTEADATDANARHCVQSTEEANVPLRCTVGVCRVPNVVRGDAPDRALEAALVAVPDGGEGREAKVHGVDELQAAHEHVEERASCDVDDEERDRNEEAAPVVFRRDVPNHLVVRVVQVRAAENRELELALLRGPVARRLVLHLDVEEARGERRSGAALAQTCCYRCSSRVVLKELDLQVELLARVRDKSTELNVRSADEVVHANILIEDAHLKG